MATLLQQARDEAAAKGENTSLYDAVLINQRLLELCPTTSWPEESEPCDGCGLTYCACDDARDEALSWSCVTVPSLAGCRGGVQL